MKNIKFGSLIILGLVCLGLVLMLVASFQYRVQKPSLTHYLAGGPQQATPAAGTLPAGAANADNLATLMAQLQESPDNINVLFALADNFMQGGDFARALPFLERAHVVNPQDIRALYLQGVCLFQSGDPAKAAEAFEKVLAIEAEPAAQFNLAILYRKHLGQLEKGTLLLDAIIANEAADATIKQQALQERQKTPNPPTEQQ